MDVHILHLNHPEQLLIGGSWATCIQTTWEVVPGCHLQSAESHSLAGVRNGQLKAVPPGVDLYPDAHNHAARES